MDEKIVAKFNQIWDSAKQGSLLSQKSAVCVSTIDEYGYPQSRFVDLKAVSETGVTFCTAYDSQKGKNLLANPKVALTAWWDHIGQQIRVVGEAKPINDDLADKYWQTRSHEAQVTSTCFKQSEPWVSETDLTAHFEGALKQSDTTIARPGSWGGFTIAVSEIEFLEFKQNRVHTREKFIRDKDVWNMLLLQP